jgi:hypothetical protein
MARRRNASVANIRGATHGGQILTSHVVALLASDLGEIQLRPLGMFRVRDLKQPEVLHKVPASGVPARFSCACDPGQRSAAHQNRANPRRADQRLETHPEGHSPSTTATTPRPPPDHDRQAQLHNEPDSPDFVGV